MVDEAGKVSTLCCIYDGVMVNAEHVAAADTFLLVTLLPHVRDHLQMEVFTLKGSTALNGTKSLKEQS